MSTILNIPEELLLVIFANLTRYDLVNVQRVCRAWYIPAHVQFLANVVLMDTFRIKQFISAIDRNPHPRYLKAVKDIHAEAYQQGIDNQLFGKLFFRFPNLQKVTIDEKLLQIFNDEQCKTFIECCPKLNGLQLKEHQLYLTNKKLHNVRLLLTNLTMRSDEVGNIVQYVSSFPRLRQFTSFSKLNKLEKLLAVLQKLSNLKTIKLQEVKNDNPENYLSTKTADERQQLVERLARIDAFDIAWTTSSQSGIEFITKYMTGLKSLKIRSNVVRGNRQHASIFCVTLFSLIGTINVYEFQVKMGRRLFWDRFPQFIQHISSHSGQGRILQLHVFQRYSSNPKISICANKEKPNIYMNIRISENDIFDRDSLFDEDFILDMDKCVFTVTEESHRMAMITYGIFFGFKSTLKEVKFNVPDVVIEGELWDDITANHTSVKKLTIQTSPTAKIQPLLKTCALAFPKLKVLSFHGFSYYSDDSFRQYKLQLGTYILERLVIDVSPINYQMKNKFYAIKVKVLSEGRLYLYKVPSDLSSKAKIGGHSLDEADHERDYFLLHVTINNLRYLQLKKSDTRRGVITLNKETTITIPIK